jgi:hypothetical protein
MATNEQEVKIRLIFGYTGHDGNVHRDVIIGRRVTGADLFKISDQAESEKATQQQLMLIQSAITGFGSIMMPVPLNVLLSLKSVDRRRLAKANNDHLRLTGENRQTEKLSDSRCRLAFGFNLGGQVYDVVEFGNLLDGYAEMEADDLPGWRQACFLLGKQITRLSQSSGPATKEGPLSVEAFETLDATDIFALQGFNGEWLDSFRLPEGDEIPKDAGSGGDLPPSPHRPDGAGDSQPVAGA